VTSVRSVVRHSKGVKNQALPRQTRGANCKREGYNKVNYFQRSIHFWAGYGSKAMTIHPAACWSAGFWRLTEYESTKSKLAGRFVDDRHSA
jgi:hypothetical protein